MLGLRSEKAAYKDKCEYALCYWDASKVALCCVQ